MQLELPVTWEEKLNEENKMSGLSTQKKLYINKNYIINSNTCGWGTELEMVVRQSSIVSDYSSR
jgi:hypothetical protein